MGSIDLQADWPLVGRAEELAELAAVIDRGRTRQDSPSGAVVVAPAGVGKTRLLREAQASARRAGIPTATVIATRSASEIPYAALAHLAPQLPTSPDADRVAWFHEFGAHLCSSYGPRPVLLVDDAQWLDPGSAALVLHLAHTTAATVIASVRRGEPTPDPITVLWSDGLALRIDVQPFSLRETERLIESVLVGEVSRRTTRRLAEVAQGNILFTRELVIGAVEAGSLRLRDGMWQWDGELVLAPRLVDAVGQRLEGLDDGHREALALLAVGEPLLLEVAEQAVDPKVIGRLEANGLVRVEATGAKAACRLAHPLYGEVVLTLVGQFERRRLTRRLADLWEQREDRSPRTVVQVASWRLETGGPASPQLLTEAAVLANQSFDHVLAQRLAEAALTAGAGPLAAVTLAQAHFGQGRFGEAERCLSDAEPAVLESRDTRLHQLYLDRCNSVVYLGLGRRDDTLARFDRFRQAHADDPGQIGTEARGLADAYRAALLLDDGDLTGSLALTEPLLAEPRAGEFTLAFALGTTGEALAYQGRTRSARAVHARMQGLSRSGSGEVRSLDPRARLQEVLCLVIEGRAEEAVTLAEELHELNADTADRSTGSLVPLALGAALLQRGTPRSAGRMLREAVAGYRELDVGGALSWCLSMASQAAALAGDHATARLLWREALASRPSYRVARLEADFVIAESLLRAAAGNVTGAARTALEGSDQLKGLAMPRARLLHLAARLGSNPRPLVAELGSLVDEAECELPALMHEHVSVLATRDGAGLDEVAEKFAGLGLRLLAAEAAAQAAVRHDEAGRRTATARSTARSQAFADRCDGATTPALRSGFARPRLSARETEVARLAATGLTNAAIAEQLVVSVRTVESHLYNAFAKLGVEHRDDLSSALPDLRR